MFDTHECPVMQIFCKTVQRIFVAMSQIPKAYCPDKVESDWYRAWLDAGAFRGRRSEDRAPYSIVIPPPNVTGVLTMGHVLNNTIQDVLARRARQEGKAVVWVPGTDHAGIATQTVVERMLREKGQSRRDLGRKAFVERVWEWRERHGEIILEQLRKLGMSCDWDRTVFTLDHAYENAVLTAFVKLFDRGYIYRGKRMVNWCPASLTALSDEEVIMKAQNSVLFRMRYEIVEAPGKYVEIATTRPETLMGDSGVAVHPEDERYADLVGKHCWRPFPRAQIPVVADEAVDPEFGTGVLKVTPAHDALDFEIGQRHGLEVIDVLNPDGTLNARAGIEFEGVDRFEARKIATAKLRELGLLIAEESYANNIGFSERADVPIEPRLSDQWWLRYPKVEEAKRAVSEGHIRFWPDRWEKTYLHWLDNIQDWCISRQLWWGHRIPVWYRLGGDRADPENWHVSLDGPPDPENWEQDEDVLDTWASSWLWPFATMGWPDPESQAACDLDFFYPTTDLVTGPDIIFFWVARMIMAGLELMGEEKTTLDDDEIRRRVPFENVYFTGIIRDDKGRKMAKSLGNSPNPFELIEKFGADGLRFGIMNIAPKGQDILFSEERIAIGRNFCNKLWNACRFRQMTAEIDDNSSLESIADRMDPAMLDEYDHWILSGLVNSMAEAERCFAEYELHQLTQTIYALFWSDYCDWYLEVSKTKLLSDANRPTCVAVQDLVIRQVLSLVAPFMPHIAEELWQRMGYANRHSSDNGGDAAGGFLQDTVLDLSAELESKLGAAGIELDKAAVDPIKNLQELVSRGRALKAAYNLAGKRDVSFSLTSSEQARGFIETHLETLKRLIGASEIAFCADDPGDSPAAVTTLGTLYLDQSASVDAKVEIARLDKQISGLEKAIASGEAKLSNENFVSRAPENVVNGVRDQLAISVERRSELERLRRGLAG